MVGHECPIMAAMVTRDQLAELLKTVNVEAVSRESGLSIKTIYRLRNRQNAPTLDTVEKLLAAVERVSSESEAKAA